jgi:hypothetical protein
MLTRMSESKGFFDKAKAAVEQAAGLAKEEVVELQVKRELGQAQKDLGTIAFQLVVAGELEHPALAEPAARIRELSARLAQAEKAPVPEDEPESAPESPDEA